MLGAGLVCPLAACLGEGGGDVVVEVVGPETNGAVHVKPACLGKLQGEPEGTRGAEDTLQIEAEAFLQLATLNVWGGTEAGFNARVDVDGEGVGLGVGGVQGTVEGKHLEVIGLVTPRGR